MPGASGGLSEGGEEGPGEGSGCCWAIRSGMGAGAGSGALPRVGRVSREGVIL